MHFDSTHYIQCVNPHCTAWHPVSKPQGARANDMFVSSEVLTPEPFLLAGIREGDHLIYLITDDLRHGDLVAFNRNGNILVGFLHVIRPDIVCLHSADGGILFANLRMSSLQTVGRVVEVQRDGARVDLRTQLRPIHATREVALQGVA